MPTFAVLMVAGLHVPVIVLFEVDGRAGATDPWQSGPIAAKVGVIEFVITISIVAVEAHCPAAGVKVYVVVPVTAVFIVAGLHVPVMLLFEVSGSPGAVPF